MMVAWSSYLSIGMPRRRSHIEILPGEHVSLTVRGVVDVHVPRRNPWGPSVSMNEVSVVEQLDGLTRLSIEMQSGDVIHVAGVAVEELGAG
jgi:hypothetical protein